MQLDACKLHGEMVKVRTEKTKFDGNCIGKMRRLWEQRPNKYCILCVTSDWWTPRFAGINRAFWHSKIGVGKIWCSSSSWKLSSPLEKLGSLGFESLLGKWWLCLVDILGPHDPPSLSFFSWLDSQWIYAPQLEFQEPTDVNARFYFEAEKTKIAKARR